MADLPLHPTVDTAGGPALYGLLVSEDNALVLGAGLLFAILAGLMIATRHVDWYRLGGAPVPAPPPR